MKDYVDLLAALLTPVIAVVTTAIVVLQYRIERQKSRLELFDKRYPVFLAAMGFIASIIAHGKPSEKDLQEFLRESKDRDLLFGDEVKEQLERLYVRGVDLMTNIEIMDPLPVGDERTKKAQEIRDLRTWFSGQYLATRGVFYPYIKFEKP